MAKNTKDSPLPTREQLLAFIADHPGAAGKREIGRAFGIKGGDKITLKRMLKDLAEEGTVEKKRGKLVRPGDLPSVSVLAVTERTPDGELIATPAEWDEEAGDPPRILLLRPPRAARNVRDAAPAPAVGDRILARLTDGGGEMPTARVIKILQRRPESVLGVVRKVGAEYRLQPVDKKQREANLSPTALGGAKEGDLVRAALSSPGRRLTASAEVTEVIGDIGDEKAVSMIAVHAHGIPYEFPAAVMAEAEKAKRAGVKDREDWRDLPLVTIDPPDAKDHDDAVHAAPDDDKSNTGGFVVTVAIADVGWYVRPGTALDREARKRGNSVYFPDRVVPMLPERISNDLGSLRVGEDRAAIAVRLVFAADGRKVSHRFHRILMRSAAKLAYAEAQSAFDGHPTGAAADLDPAILRTLWQAYLTVARARAQRQPLELEIPERKVIIGKDGKIERIVTPKPLEANRLIEEFMIQANVAAAETLEKAKSPLVYRIHDSPSLAKLEALREFLATIEVSFPKAGNLRPSHFNQILSRLKEGEHGRLIHEVVLRTQSQAEYSPENIGHFGLNLRRYAHFTSPIRRYADLIVHRGLIGSLDLGAGGLPDGIENELPVIAAEISAAERRAMLAERETIDRLVAHWLADRIGANFTGRVAGVTRAGLFVKLDDTGADGFVPISTLGSDYFVHDEARHALIGRHSGEMHRLGDEVEVRLLEVAPIAGALRFELLSEGRQAPARGGRGGDRRDSGAKKFGRGKPQSRRGEKKRGRR